MDTQDTAKVPQGRGFSYRRASSGGADYSSWFERAHNLLAQETDRAFAVTCREMGIPVPGQTNAVKQAPTAKEQAFDAIVAKLGLSDEAVRDILVKSSGLLDSAASSSEDSDDADASELVPRDVLTLHEATLASRNSSTGLPATNKLMTVEESISVLEKARQVVEKAKSSSADSQVSEPGEKPQFLLARS